MKITLKTPLDMFFGDLGDVTRLFYGDVAISAEDGGDIVIEHEFSSEEDVYTDRWSSQGHEITFTRRIPGDNALILKRMRKRAAKMGLYYLLKEITGMAPPWGSLTGIRPTRLLYEAFEEGLDEAQTCERLTGEYDVSPARVRLLFDIAEMQKGNRNVPDGMFDLYIGIPFCATRCAYCSFSSGEIGSGKLVEPYISALIREIRACGELIKEHGLKVRAAYIGGGTPTSISADQLRRVLCEVNAAFPGAVEWTVEAGRPDTIDREKLNVIKDSGVGRISVNPQTFCDETLVRVGRAHTGEDTVRAYLLARELGFDDINMDLIAGLPGEDMAVFTDTLNKTLELAPESVTVHSLAIKRSSRLHEYLHVNQGGHTRIMEKEAAKMIDFARRELMANGYGPYYLYRQKYMAANLENVGYAKPGKACLYNIGNMEETACVLALGAGAISKWIFDRELRIERAPNVKNIEEYISRVDEMISRKRALLKG